MQQVEIEEEEIPTEVLAAVAEFLLPQILRFYGLDEKE